MVGSLHFVDNTPNFISTYHVVLFLDIIYWYVGKEVAVVYFEITSSREQRKVASAAVN